MSNAEDIRNALLAAEEQRRRAEEALQAAKEAAKAMELPPQHAPRPGVE